MSMGDKFDILFEKMKQEFQKQTIDITDNLINNLSKKIDERIKPIQEENTLLYEEIKKLQKRVEFLERDSKRNNIVIFHVEETEKNMNELLNGIQKKIIEDLNISLEKSELNNVYRVGKRKQNGKPRPIVVSFVNAWKRDEVLRNKNKFRIVGICEDYPKEVIEKRKRWKLEMKEERNKGNIAYLVYDKLLVKPRTDKKETIDRQSLGEIQSNQNQIHITNSLQKAVEYKINKLFDEPLFHENAIEVKGNDILQNSIFHEDVKENKIEEFKPQKRKIPSHYGY